MELFAKALEELIEEGRRALSPSSAELFEQLVRSYTGLADAIRSKTLTLRQLHALFQGKSCEKSDKVLPPEEAQGDGQAADRDKTKKKPKGHGRNGADQYPGAERVEVPHETLRPGDACPLCTKGTLYEKTARKLIRVTGQAPLRVVIFECQCMRCGLCNATFTAKPPPDVGSEKYDARSAAMIALLKYGSGLPFYRLERLQKNPGLPLPKSTQWDIAQGAATKLAPVFDQMIHFAANAEVIHNDDTSARILALKNKPPTDEDGIDKNRTGIHTTGIVATEGSHQVALFFTGRLHAGENLQQVLARRHEPSPPIQMADALAHNVPKESETILANCNAHGRRYFVNQIENLPEECRKVIEALREVYRVDAKARTFHLSPEQRLTLHQRRSQPIMDDLETWLADQLEAKQVEPNSGLGKAIRYMRKHWSELTLFLRVPGAPLDNNNANAARGITDTMPRPGLCRVASRQGTVPRQKGLPARHSPDTPLTWYWGQTGGEATSPTAASSSRSNAANDVAELRKSPSKRLFSHEAAVRL